MKLGEYELNQIYTGDARELAKGIPDESVDLIHTDPPYPKEFLYVWHDLAEFASRVLKQGGSLITLCGHYQVPHVIHELTSFGLRYHWIGWLINREKPTSMAFRTVRGGKPFIWFAKGQPIIKHGFFWDTKSGSRDKRFHEWGQPIGYVTQDLQVLTVASDIVLDPFTGGGNVLEACKLLHRNFIGFEIDSETAKVARNRLQELPEMLPFLHPDSYQGRLFDGMESATEHKT